MVCLSDRIQSLLGGVLNNDKEDFSFTHFGIPIFHVPWKISKKYVRQTGASWF